MVAAASATRAGSYFYGLGVTRYILPGALDAMTRS